MTVLEEAAVAALLARPDSVRSVQQPVVGLRDGRCAGYGGAVRVADWVGRESGPWFQAAASAGLSGHLAGLALHTCLRARATMPGERFLVTEVSGRVLTSDPVIAVLDDEDDVGDLILILTGELGLGADQVIGQFRGRGLRFAASAGSAGLDDLEALSAWRPDVITLPPTLVRGIEDDPLRQALVALVVDLAEDLSHNLYGGTPAGNPTVVSPEDCGVIADGVETLAEVAALRDLGVRWAQGWLLGRLRAGFQAPAVDLQTWVATLDESADQHDAPDTTDADDAPRPLRAVPSGA